ncbi:hypothetical protein K7X08_013157 [Anisodus acutangulus]|uniref:Photolyase/cryptochrome alpha/beta domain-containing protein n=1 Tax=Anisodus acutangulus TaxID=402998 RepID=A0A9Q1MB90_9SOLA|nr:hypothetical protein K7X08_013157 [Anisodus acutangulus]
MASAIPVVQSSRIRVLKQGSGPLVGPVVYWMFRDQRIRDNWALIHAVDQANKANVPVAIAFNLFDQFLAAKAGQLGFMAVDTFLEEMIVRRELADNFCYYQPQYDSLLGAWEWARKTLMEHAADKREHIYTPLECFSVRDGSLWKNAWFYEASNAAPNLWPGPAS